MEKEIKIEAQGPAVTLPPTPTRTPNRTNTPTRTPVTTKTPNRTGTPTRTPFPTRTPSRTAGPTRTPTRTPAPTRTPSRTPALTRTPNRTNTPTRTPGSGNVIKNPPPPVSPPGSPPVSPPTSPPVSPPVSPPPGVSAGSLIESSIPELNANTTGCSLYVWGLGLYTTNNPQNAGVRSANINSPIAYTRVGGANEWLDVSADHFIAGIKTDGSLWQWGKMRNGNGGLYDVVSPTRIGGDSNWKKVLVCGGSGFAINQNNQLYGWGQNQFGLIQAANASLPNQTIAPVAIRNVAPGLSIKSIFGKSDCIFAITTSNEMYSWGRNDVGQLGNGTNTGPTNGPTPAPGYRVLGSSKWYYVSYTGDSGIAYGGFAVGVGDGGELYAWGSNGSGGVVTGNRNATTTGNLTFSATTGEVNCVPLGGTCGHIIVPTPRKIEGMNPMINPGQGKFVKSLSCGRQFTTVVNTQGELWAWGQNNTNQLGLNNPSAYIRLPARVGSKSDWRGTRSSIFNSLALDNSGNMYGWGSNSFVNRVIAAGSSGAEPESIASPLKTSPNVSWNKVSPSSNGGYAVGLRRE